jgi:hypothetical protein
MTSMFFTNLHYLQKLSNRKAPKVNYNINDHDYTMGINYLVDGIYPLWATLFKIIPKPWVKRSDPLGLKCDTINSPRRLVTTFLTSNSTEFEIKLLQYQSTSSREPENKAQ